MIHIVNSLGKAVGLNMGDTKMDVDVQKDNTDALILARTFHPSSLHLERIMRPRLFGFVRILLSVGSSFWKLI